MRRPRASVEAEAQPPAFPMFAKISRGPNSSLLIVTYRLPQPVTFSRVSPTSTAPQLRRSRGAVLVGETREKVTGCGSLYVTINSDEFGPREIFANMGKAGGCASASTEALGRLISLAFRYGAPPEKIAKQLKGIRCHVPLGFGPKQVLSCPDAIGKAISDKYCGDCAVAEEHEEAVQQLEMPIAYAQGACPDCGGAIEHEGGCMVCRACGFSRCSCGRGAWAGA